MRKPGELRGSRGHKGAQVVNRLGKDYKSTYKSSKAVILGIFLDVGLAVRDCQHITIY
jgi:hypothetical protein